MILLVSGGTRTLDRYLPDARLGRLAVPYAQNRVEGYQNVPWAGDNGAFSGFDEQRFLGMLRELDAARATCLWIAAPDVVADVDETMALWLIWGAELRRRGWPVALVCQDGLTKARVPWYDLDAVFIGGTTAYKLGPDAQKIVREAKRRRRWAHMGRVNTRRRVLYAQSIGCDSIDGSKWSRFGETYLPRGLDMLSGRQLALTEGAV